MYGHPPPQPPHLRSMLTPALTHLLCCPPTALPCSRPDSLAGNGVFMVGGNNQNMAAGQITGANSHTTNVVGGSQTINSWEPVSNKGEQDVLLPLLLSGTVSSCCLQLPTLLHPNFPRRQPQC